MALISMAVYDTEENQRDLYTRSTLQSLMNTVDFTRHRLVISDNGSYNATQSLYEEFEAAFPFFQRDNLIIIKNGKNLGTAEAINQAWRLRKPGEHCIKIDNDVVINYVGWADEMERAISVDDELGQVGLKRKDLWENPNHPDPFYKSKLMFLEHEPGQPWIVVEKVNHVMGTCVLHSSKLLDKIGYMKQPALYGFDDSLTSLRAQLAGFKCVFLPHINIDHIDTGNTDFQKWKERYASEQWEKYHEMVDAYKTKKESLYYNPF